MADATALWISGHLAEKIRAHGAETYPHECCGALLGRDLSSVAGSDRGSGAEAPAREILQLFPLVNRRDDSPRNRFSVTPEDVLAAEKAAREQGLEVVGWYHSHPDHPARPALCGKARFRRVQCPDSRGSSRPPDHGIWRPAQASFYRRRQAAQLCQRLRK